MREGTFESFSFIMLFYYFISPYAYLYPHCQLVLRISGNMLFKNTSQCKILIVPEEGWFDQPKSSTPSKNILRCVGFCLYTLRSISHSTFFS